MSTSIIKYSRLFTSALFVFSVFLTGLLRSEGELEIRRITPPQLDTAHLGQEILCHRPMRRGSPKMSVEEKNGKVIAHNYGHGGSGFTLAPGCAQYVNELLLDSDYAGLLDKETTSITIIGAGVLGLFSAYDLLQRGFKNITIIAENFENLTSHNAGGLLAPVSMDNDPAIQKVIEQVGIYAYQFYKAIAERQHAHFQEGAIIVPTYFANREDSGLEPYVGKVMHEAKDVIIDFDNGTTHKMVVYDDGIFIDTAKIMSGLIDYLRQNNVVFEQRKINAFADINSAFIINCCGLGSTQLNGDTDMVSVQGHLIMLKDQDVADLQYMILIYLDEGVTESGQKIKRSFYIFPKRLPHTGINDVGVLGGTFIENATSATPNEKEFSLLLHNARVFYDQREAVATA